MGVRVYIVEDDAALCRELARLLEGAGFEVLACTDFANAAAQAVDARPDVVLLDVRLPGADGRAICRDIRAASPVPIIMLTSLDSEFDEVMGMNLGADDYITKPYRPAVLLARIEALLRREGSTRDVALLDHRGVVLDLAAGTVGYQGQTAELTRNELRILALLMRRAGQVVSRADLMCELWESDAFIDDNTLTVNVNRLRSALARIGVPADFLQTRRGQGYQLTIDPGHLSSGTNLAADDNPAGAGVARSGSEGAIL